MTRLNPAAPARPADVSEGHGDSPADPRPRLPDEIYEVAFQHAPIAIALISLAEGSVGRIEQVNDAYCELFGFRREELLGHSLLELTHPDDQLTDLRRLDEFGRGRHPELIFEKRYLRSDGEVVLAQVRAATVWEGDGRPSYAVSQIEDVTELRRSQSEEAEAKQMLQRSEQRYREILERTPDGVCRADAAGRFDFVNERMAQMLGYTVEEMIGRHFAEFVDPDRRQSLEGNLEYQSSYAGTMTFECCLRRKDGQPCWVRISTASLTDDEGASSGSLTCCSDITEAKAAGQALRSSEHLVSAIADCMAEGMFALDSDGCLTYMNRAAERMLGWSEEELRGRSMHEATHSVRKDRSAYPLEECPLLGVRTTGRPVHVTDDAFVTRSGELLPVSYTSSPLVTDALSGAVVVFRDITQTKSEESRIANELEALSWVGRIRDALDEGRFVLYAQPIIELRTGAVTQHELLIRMLGPRGELIPPSAFLPTAERFGLIEEIDQWVIDQAARLVGEGHAVALQFNLSGKSMGHADLGARIGLALREHRGEPQKLICEITETALVEQAAAGEDFVRELNALGCGVALDDFGTGYGGFTYLKRLPVSYLKIDIEFVRDLAENAASRHVVAAVVNLAHGFGQKTIAEGVEDQHTLALLEEMGVDYAQGYAIARPAPATEVLKSGEQNTSNTGARSP